MSTDTLLLLATSDGRLHLLSLRTGRVEKSVDAHAGAVLSAKWSPDASAIASGGEDGLVKVWSKGLLLRSTLSAQSSAIYALDWSTSSSGLNSLAFVSHGTIHIKPITPHSKAVSWKGHDGVILCLSWGGALIATAGEDKKYKLWDERGRLLYTSNVHEYPITCIAWCNEALIVGSFNLLKLVLKDGTATSSQYLPSVHSLTNVSCSPDFTSIVASTTSGRIVFASITGRSVETSSHRITTIHSNRLSIHSTVNSGDEYEMDTSPANIIAFSASFGHVIAVSSKPSGFIYKLSSKTEYKFDVKSANVTLILQCDRSFALFDSSTGSLCLFTYDGKILVPSIKWIGAPTYESMIDANLLSLSHETVAAVDSMDSRVIHWISVSPQSSKSSGNVTTRGTHQTAHSLEVTTVALSSRQSRLCAYIDINGDVYLVKANTDRSIKFSSSITSIRWSESHNLLAGITQSKQLLLWLSPNILFSDTDLSTQCVIVVDTLQESSSLSLVHFSDTTIIIAASLTHLTYKINAICVLLDEYCRDSGFSKAINLCRLLPSDDMHTRALWSCLAGSALQSHSLNIAEIAYNQLDSVHRVVYLHTVQQLTDNNARNGELALLAGQVEQSESIFLQSSFILRVIILRLTLFKWEGALQLALQHQHKHPEYVTLVLWKRSSYLHQLQRSEDLKLFIDHADDLDDDDDTVVDTVTHLLHNPYSKS